MLLPYFAVEIALFAFFAKPTCKPFKMYTIKALAALPPSLVDKGIRKI